MASNPFFDSLLKRALPGVSNNAEQANEVVRNHVLWSLGAGLVPVPVLDVAAVTAVQVDMIQALAKQYGVPYNENQGKTILSALAGSTLARLGASAVKAIPVVGTVIGGASMAVLSGASTYAAGLVFIKHFEDGGTLDSFSASAYKTLYNELLKEGRVVAGRMQQQQQAAPAQDAYARLEKLQKLRERGIITAEEFETKKAELLREL
jgi:uncharacterized protein (DUF697 family)